jgi:dihydrofolate reductase
VSKLRVKSFAISIDGYGAGPNQCLQNPLGVRGPELMEWFFHTHVWRRMHGSNDGETGVDNGIAEQGFAGIGAWILGRNMFGPVRGPWPDESWKGWWGDEPPYHTPVFVLTHHPRAPLRMAGGTEFRFVTEGIHAAMEQATAAAGGRDVRLGGGVSTIRQFLRAGLIDELHLAIRPVLLGSGEPSMWRANVRLTSFCANARNPSGSLSGPPNPRLERTVRRGWWRATSALRYFALASRWMRLRAAAQAHR